MALRAMPGAHKKPRTPEIGGRGAEEYFRKYSGLLISRRFVEQVAELFQIFTFLHRVVNRCLSCELLAAVVRSLDTQGNPALIAVDFDHAGRYFFVGLQEIGRASCRERVQDSGGSLATR